MLTEADGAAGKNFLTPQIHDVARRRLAQPRGLVNEYRLLHNMLSSQPMCFNLFAPLATDLELGTRLVRAAWGQHIARVTRVELEWAPTPEKAYLDDRTSFDAFIEYQRHDGALGFIGIETKLTEPFSETHVDKPTYRRWMTHDSPWHPDRDGFDRIEHNQLWRDHLLAWAMLRHPQSRYAEGRFTLLYHPEDQRCRKVVEGYRRLLQDQSSLDSWTLDQLVPLWKSVLGNGSWLDDFAVRYLDLHLSHASTAKRNSVSPKPAGPTVRRGHWAALEQLELPDAYAQTRAMYRELLGTDVYLRPTDSGFTVLSLDSTTCDSMIGVGSRGGNEHSLRRLPPERHQVEAACAGYHDKRSSLKRASAEERYALRLIQAALSNGLGVPRPNTYFVTQEWRLPSGKKLDLLCVDPLGRRLVVVELKADEATARSSGAAEARQYAEEIHQHRAELYPFFQRLARTLARHHHAPALLHNLELDPNLPPQSAVSWPGSAFHG